MDAVASPEFLGEQEEDWCFHLVKVTGDGDVLCPNEEESGNIEDLMRDANDVNEPEEQERKRLLDRLDVINSLITKLGDYQKVSGQLPKVEKSELSTLTKEAQAPSVSLGTLVNGGNISSPEGKRQRKPNPRFLDSATASGNLRPPTERTTRDILLTECSEQPDVTPAPLSAPTFRELESEAVLASGSGDVDLLDDDDVALIEADDLQNMQSIGFEASFELGSWGGTPLDDTGTLAKVPSPFNNFDILDVSPEMPSDDLEVAIPLRGPRNAPKAKASTSPKKGAHLPKPAMGTRVPTVSAATTTASASLPAPLAAVISPREPGKRQSKPNPKFFEEERAEGQISGGATSSEAVGNSKELQPSAVTVPRTAPGRARGTIARKPTPTTPTTPLTKVKQKTVEERVFIEPAASQNKRPREESRAVSSTATTPIEDDPRSRKKTRQITPVRPYSPEADRYDDDSDELTDDESPTGARKMSGSKRHNADGGRRSKHHNPWALEEAEALVEGVARCGGGKWADIKKLGFPAIQNRSAVDLKDKWRNLLRIAMLPNPPTPKSGDKKREIPPSLLSRVRELAARAARSRPPDGRSNRGRLRTPLQSV
ncbi:mitogen-activated protein kinase tyrosine protein phosphatase sdp1 [Cymbomonas tetramitiformis]|uniref:Mitogen-activated protein kinase tyrosine protein phosphatase sdp1 n=1 Tax=Cymbomonas tetramitiformis TaxID=36881 RepID=A0AAE0L3N0_9CHLO|nr:mitogen-activated protein kinase tyrosine protein phosphatase sdp1 [Cymbomonas tetramitiformis]